MQVGASLVQLVCKCHVPSASHSTWKNGQQTQMCALESACQDECFTHNGSVGFGTGDVAHLAAAAANGSVDAAVTLSFAECCWQRDGHSQKGDCFELHCRILCGVWSALTGLLWSEGENSEKESNRFVFHK